MQTFAETLEKPDCLLHCVAFGCFFGFGDLDAAEYHPMRLAFRLQLRRRKNPLAPQDEDSMAASEAPAAVRGLFITFSNLAGYLRV